MKSLFKNGQACLKKGNYCLYHPFLNLHPIFERERKLMLVPFEANCTTLQFLPLNFTNHQHQIFIILKNCCYLPPQASVCVKLKTYVLLLSGDSLFVGEQPLVIHSSQRWQAYFHSASIGERVKHVFLGLKS